MTNLRWHSADYRTRDGGGVRGALADRGFWLHLTRPLLACQLAGHRPVVDGTEPLGTYPAHRWVCCDRCGIRPEPQGDLDPAIWSIGDRIDLATRIGIRRRPGGWPARAEGVIGGQVIVGGRTTLGASVKVGNKGSEHVLAAHACVPWLGGLYLHTEGFGTWVQRRLNPAGYESRVTSLEVHAGRVWWRVWAPRDSGPAPRWQDGSLRIDPRDIALGERRYTYTPAGGPVTGALRDLDGAAYEYTATLNRQACGRRHGRARLSWSVSFDLPAAGIPYQPGKSGMTGWSVPVDDQAVAAGMWLDAAIAASIAKVTGLRIRYEYKRPSLPVTLRVWRLYGARMRQMTQVAPYPAELADLVGRITYKPGWTFQLADRDRGQGSAGLTLEITVHGPDSYDPGKRRSVSHPMIVPAAAYDARAWRWWVFKQILDVEAHEAAEFFQVDSKRPYPPNHGEGRDPYQILELGTVEDAETDFRGIRHEGTQA